MTIFLFEGQTVNDDKKRPIRATLPTSTKALNKQLDQQIVEREPPDYDAAWFWRRHVVTLYSTMRAWVVRH